MARIQRAALSSQVVDQLADDILSGRVAANETLPPEQVLADQFGVSKTVVREAMKILAAKGLVSIRQGIGTTVNAREAWQSFDPMIILRGGKGTTFRDLIQVRQIIEPEVAALSCARGGDHEFLQGLAQLIEKGGAVTSVEDHVRYDVAFHQALADASGNDLLVMMMNSIGQFLKASRQALFDVPGALGRAYAYHEEIFEAIRREDVEASRDAMRRHLDQVERDYGALVAMKHEQGS